MSEELKPALDAIAAIVADWPEGTRNAYVPRVLPGLVQELKTQLAAERQARQDAELLARAANNPDGDEVCYWVAGILFVWDEDRSHWYRHECEFANGFPVLPLPPAIRAAIQAAEGRP